MGGGQQPCSRALYRELYALLLLLVAWMLRARAVRTKFMLHLACLQKTVKTSWIFLLLKLQPANGHKARETRYRPVSIDLDNGLWWWTRYREHNSHSLCDVLFVMSSTLGACEDASSSFVHPPPLKCSQVYLYWTKSFSISHIWGHRHFLSPTTLQCYYRSSLSLAQFLKNRLTAACQASALCTLRLVGDWTGLYCGAGTTSHFPLNHVQHIVFCI